MVACGLKIAVIAAIETIDTVSTIPAISAIMAILSIPAINAKKIWFFGFFFVSLQKETNQQ